MRKSKGNPPTPTELERMQWEKLETEAQRVLKRWEAGGPEAEAEIKEAEKWANEVFASYGELRPNRYMRRNANRNVH